MDRRAFVLTVAALLPPVFLARADRGARVRRRDALALLGRCCASWPVIAREQQQTTASIGYFDDRPGTSW